MNVHTHTHTHTGCVNAHTLGVLMASTRCPNTEVNYYKGKCSKDTITVELVGALIQGLLSEVGSIEIPLEYQFPSV